MSERDIVRAVAAVDPDTDAAPGVKGRAREVVDPTEIRRVGQLDLAFWGLGEKSHWIRIEPQEVTGRRIENGPSTPIA